MENILQSNKSIIVVDETSTFDFTKQSWRDDVTFLVEDKRLYASKSVLALISPVFEGMFGAGFKEKTENQVSLPGKKAEDFLEFLHCVYPTSTRAVTRHNVFQVLPLAHEYQVKQLVEKCKNILGKYVTDEKEIDIKDLLKCYTTATRYNLTDVDALCIEKVLDENSSAMVTSEAEKNMDKDTLLKFKTSIIDEQSKRIGDITTKFVLFYLKTTNITTHHFENAKGAVIEQALENVFDPVLLRGVQSKSIKLWNVKFSLKISVASKVEKWQSDKYLSLYLSCDIPEKWTCKVNAAIVLENVYAAENKGITTKSFSTEFTSPESISYGYQHFENLSKFLTETPGQNDNYTGRVVVYILAKQPTKEHSGEEDTE